MKYIKINEKYRLKEDEVVKLSDDFAGINVQTEFISLMDCILVIKERYAWDGPSGPTWDTPAFIAASATHDCLYQLMRLGLIPDTLRDAADRELARLQVMYASRKYAEKGIFNSFIKTMVNIRAPIDYLGVHWFAKKASQPKIEKVYEI